MRFDRLILKDFLTYENLDYSFENKPLLIQGLNLTDDGQTTNGTGKSGLQTGIEQCITASNSRDVRDNEIITYGKKQANCQLFTSCDVRKETLHIDWDIKLSGSNVLRLKIKKYDEDWKSDETQNVSFSNVNDGKKAIMDWFAISKEDLFNYYLVNNTRFKSFFKSSNTDKVALINRFSDASIIEGIEKIDTKTIQEDIKNKQTQIDETNGKIDLTKTQIEKELSRDLEQENEDKVKEIDSDICDIKEEIEESNESIKSKKESINSTNLLIKSNKETKDSIALEKAPFEKKKLAEEIRLNDINIELESAKALLATFKATDWNLERKTFNSGINTHKEDLKPLEATKKSTEEQSKKIEVLLNSIDVKLSGAIECPKCSHKFLLGEETIPALEEKKTKVIAIQEQTNSLKIKTETSITKAKENIVLLEKEISSINAKEGVELEAKNKLQVSVNDVSKKVNEISTVINSLVSSIASVDKKETTRLLALGTLESSLLKLNSDIKIVENEILSYEKDIQNLESDKLSLKIGDNKEQVKTLQKNLKSLDATLNTYRTELISLNEKLYEVNQWIQNFKQFRMHLANQSLEVIEYHCNRYLGEMGSDLIVKMEGFKVRADGTIKEEINAIIIRDIERTFSSFSGGERGRLLFASILANRCMINETHPYGGLDFLGVDEVFEGVDAAGLSSLITSAKLLDIPVMLITHVSMEENDNILTIVKQNNVSFIK